MRKVRPCHFSDPIFIDVLKRSLWVAVLTTVLCLLLGYPVAYIIAQSSGRKKVMLVLLITIPMWINMLVRTYAWVGILQNHKRNKVVHHTQHHGKVGIN